MRSVFVCCLTDWRDESSLEFAMMLLSLGTLLPGANVQVHFTTSMADGLAEFGRARAKAGRLDIDDDLFFGIDTMMSGQAFLKEAVACPHAYVLGVHPKPPVDWERVGRGLTPYVTNYDSSTKGFVKLPATAKDLAQARAFWLKSKVLNDLGHHRAWEWQGDVHVDTRNQLTVMGKQPFTGCIGHRVRLVK